MKHIKHYFKGFTLVELIIVITILAILATIAFISFQNYSLETRDANRLSTIKNIETWLELFSIKTWNFPKPEEVTIFTWWLNWKTQINQWIIWESVSQIIQMSKTPLDPKDKNNYVYSTFWSNNRYYQIWIDAENQEISFLPQVYAKSKTSIVKWNYKFDPSLPSLILVENEALTNSWIFSPEVCFVLDWGKNSLNECNEIKSEMNLKDYDNTLVWYWDMESLTWNLLKDLSGNENHWTFSWWMNYTTALTEWTMWKWLYFSWNIIEVTSTGTNLNINGTWVTVMVTFKPDIELFSYRPRVIMNWELYNITICNDPINKDWGNCWIEKRYFIWQWKTDKWRIDVSAHKKNYTPSFWEMYSQVAFLIDLEKKIKKISVNWNIYMDDFWGRKWVNNWSEQFNTVSDLLYFWWDGEKLWTWTESRIFHWVIDDIKIYNRTLSDQEILQQSKIAWF